MCFSYHFYKFPVFLDKDINRVSFRNRLCITLINMAVEYFTVDVAKPQDLGFRQPLADQFLLNFNDFCIGYLLQRCNELTPYRLRICSFVEFKDQFLQFILPGI